MHEVFECAPTRASSTMIWEYTAQTARLLDRYLKCSSHFSSLEVTVRGISTCSHDRCSKCAALEVFVAGNSTHSSDSAAGGWPACVIADTWCERVALMWPVGT